jgi:hypothetical protein
MKKILLMFLIVLIAIPSALAADGTVNWVVDTFSRIDFLLRGTQDPLCLEKNLKYYEDMSSVKETFSSVEQCADYALEEGVCVGYFAGKTDEPNLCSDYQSGRMKEIFEQDCYFGYGMDKGEAKNCEVLEDAKAKEYCFYGVAMKTRDPQFCLSDHCRKFLATLKRDHKVCSHWSCIMSIAIKTNDIQLCGKAGQQRDHCVLSVLQNSERDESACKEYFPNNEEYYQSCLSSITAKKGSVDACLKLKDKRMTGSCLHSVNLKMMRDKVEAPKEFKKINKIYEKNPQYEPYGGIETLAKPEEPKIQVQCD